VSDVLGQFIRELASGGRAWGGGFRGWLTWLLVAGIVACLIVIFMAIATWGWRTVFGH